MMTRTHEQFVFIASVVGLCILYLAFEIFVNSYTILSVDDFWFAHRIYQFKDGLPYRDFAPYKTVLGYYLLLLPMLAKHGLFKTLIFTKNAIALLNSVVFMLGAIWLSRFFSRTSILITLCLLITAEYVLTYSTNIRVDLIGYWFCFFSFLLILENRFWSAGVLLGIGFITTQKAIWFILASNCSLGLYWLCLARHLSTLRNIIKFNTAAVLPILLYLIFWSLLSNFKTVTDSMFYEAAIMYQLTWYNSARILFWSIITLFNPLLFLMWPLTFISILVSYQEDHYYRERFLTVIYALTILFCLIPYKQIFPYYMQVTIPVLMILFSAFFTWLFAIFKSHHVIKLLVPKKYLWLFIICYLFAMVFIWLLFQLPEVYLLLGLVPILLCTYLCNPQQEFSALFFNLILSSMILVGGVYPLTLFFIKMLNTSGAYQKANIRAVNALLKDGSDYVAGIELIYYKTQPIAGMRHLMGPAIDYLTTGDEKLRPVLLPSLYLTPNVSAQTAIADLDRSAVKFYVNNYRMHALPPSIKKYLTAHYDHFWGSIYLYAPYIEQGLQHFEIKFSGNYLIKSTSSHHIIIDGHSYNSHNKLYLQKGNHIAQSDVPFRLNLIPAESIKLNKKFEFDEWEKLLG